jgi:hypothetical protein
VNIFAGYVGSLGVASCTSCMVQGGKGKGGVELFAGTDGGQIAPVNGTVTEPGKLVSIRFDD